MLCSAAAAMVDGAVGGGGGERDDSTPASRGTARHTNYSDNDGDRQEQEQQHRHRPSSASTSQPCLHVELLIPFTRVQPEQSHITALILPGCRLQDEDIALLFGAHQLHEAGAGRGTDVPSVLPHLFLLDLSHNKLQSFPSFLWNRNRKNTQVDMEPSGIITPWVVDVSFNPNMRLFPSVVMETPLIGCLSLRGCDRLTTTAVCEGLKGLVCGELWLPVAVDAVCVQQHTLGAISINGALCCDTVQLAAPQHVKKCEEHAGQLRRRFSCRASDLSPPGATAPPHAAFAVALIDVIKAWSEHRHVLHPRLEERSRLKLREASQAYIFALARAKWSVFSDVMFLARHFSTDYSLNRADVEAASTAFAMARTSRRNPSASRLQQVVAGSSSSSLLLSTHHATSPLFFNRWKELLEKAIGGPFDDRNRFLPTITAVAALVGAARFPEWIPCSLAKTIASAVATDMALLLLPEEASLQEVIDVLPSSIHFWPECVGFEAFETFLFRTSPLSQELVEAAKSHERSRWLANAEGPNDVAELPLMEMVHVLRREMASSSSSGMSRPNSAASVATMEVDTEAFQRLERAATAAASAARQSCEREAECQRRALEARIAENETRAMRDGLCRLGQHYDRRSMPAVLQLHRSGNSSSASRLHHRSLDRLGVSLRATSATPSSHADDTDGQTMPPGMDASCIPIDADAAFVPAASSVVRNEREGEGVSVSAEEVSGTAPLHKGFLPSRNGLTRLLRDRVEGSSSTATGVRHRGGAAFCQASSFGAYKLRPGTAEDSTTDLNVTAATANASPIDSPEALSPTRRELQSTTATMKRPVSSTAMQLQALDRHQRFESAPLLSNTPIMRAASASASTAAASCHGSKPRTTCVEVSLVKFLQSRGQCRLQSTRERNVIQHAVEMNVAELVQPLPIRGTVTASPIPRDHMSHIPPFSRDEFEQAWDMLNIPEGSDFVQASHRLDACLRRLHQLSNVAGKAPGEVLSSFVTLSCFVCPQDGITVAAAIFGDEHDHLEQLVVRTLDARGMLREDWPDHASSPSSHLYHQSKMIMSDAGTLAQPLLKAFAEAEDSKERAPPVAAVLCTSPEASPLSVPPRGHRPPSRLSTSIQSESAALRHTMQHRMVPLRSTPQDPASLTTKLSATQVVDAAGCVHTVHPFFSQAQAVMERQRFRRHMKTVATDHAAEDGMRKAIQRSCSATLQPLRHEHPALVGRALGEWRIQNSQFIPSIVRQHLADATKQRRALSQEQ